MLENNMMRLVEYYDGTTKDEDLALMDMENPSNNTKRHTHTNTYCEYTTKRSFQFFKEETKRRIQHKEKGKESSKRNPTKAKKKRRKAS
jgi:hypothetical protein